MCLMRCEFREMTWPKKADEQSRCELGGSDAAARGASMLDTVLGRLLAALATFGLVCAFMYVGSRIGTRLDVDGGFDKQAGWHEYMPPTQKVSPHGAQQPQLVIFLHLRKCGGTAFGGWKTRDAIPMLVNKMQTVKG